MITTQALLALQAYRHGGGSNGILDWIMHAAIWTFVSQTIHFLFHEFPLLGWAGTAALVLAVIMWIRIRKLTREGPRR
ncbi:hypothetical protein ABH924_003293 [Arthrobacter sp. GAS37]|uniref:hypothetical protein n=1 Tax=Arthrobacter sp. GAS37 TaxID=3156261 RepID=UPI003832E837